MLAGLAAVAGLARLAALGAVPAAPGATPVASGRWDLAIWVWPPGASWGWIWRLGPWSPRASWGERARALRSTPDAQRHQFKPLTLPSSHRCDIWIWAVRAFLICRDGFSALTAWLAVGRKISRRWAASPRSRAPCSRRPRVRAVATVLERSVSLGVQQVRKAQLAPTHKEHVFNGDGPRV